MVGSQRRSCCLLFSPSRWYANVSLVIGDNNDLVLCSFNSCIPMDSITSHIGLPWHHPHSSCSRLAQSRSFNEVAMSLRRASHWRAYLPHHQVGIVSCEQIKPLSDCHLSSAYSPGLHEKYVRELGRNVRLRGIHPVRRSCVLSECAH